MKFVLEIDLGGTNMSSASDLIDAIENIVAEDLRDILYKKGHKSTEPIKPGDIVPTGIRGYNGVCIGQLRLEK